jgi:hypothetical protein
MLSSAIRLTVFVPVAIWISKQPGFQLERLWVVSVAAVWIQAGASYLLLRHQFSRRLIDGPRTLGSAPGPAVAAVEN